MQYYASQAKGRIYPYYKCQRVVCDGNEACPAGRSRPKHRAERLEETIWGFVSELMKSPEQLREDLERMVELEKGEMTADPTREAEVWFEKLAEADRMRAGYQDLAAKRLMIHEELGDKLERLKEVRETAERELRTLLDRRERVEQLERDKDELLNSYAKVAPEALDSLSSEERHRLYTMLRMKVTANPDRSLEVSGALGAQFGQSEMIPR